MLTENLIILTFLNSQKLFSYEPNGMQCYIQAHKMGSIFLLILTVKVSV